MLISHGRVTPYHFLKNIVMRSAAYLMQSLCYDKFRGLILYSPSKVLLSDVLLGYFFSGYNDLVKQTSC